MRVAVVGRRETTEPGRFREGDGHCGGHVVKNRVVEASHANDSDEDGVSVDGEKVNRLIGGAGVRQIKLT